MIDVSEWREGNFVIQWRNPNTDQRSLSSQELQPQVITRCVTDDDDDCGGADAAC